MVSSAPQPTSEAATAAAAAPLRYTLVCSGTFNPPHRGHALMGLHAAARLAARGHRVDRLLFLPVSDNYLLNKLASRIAPAAGAAPSASLAMKSDAPHFSMAARCELLSSLVDAELARRADVVAPGHVAVLPYEQAHAERLLQDSPSYWGRLLPGGYLRTVPTAALIRVLAADNQVVPPGARLGLVFGVDNLAGMASWELPAQLMARSDLVLIGRGDGDSLDLQGAALAPLLSAIRCVEADACVPLVLPADFEAEAGGGAAETEGGGGRVWRHTRAAPDSATGGASARSAVLYAFGSPCSSVRHLSSTAIREAMATLKRHGYGDAGMLMGPSSGRRKRLASDPGDGADSKQVTGATFCSGAALGGLLGGWVGGGQWASHYSDAVARGELAGAAQSPLSAAPPAFPDIILGCK